MTADRKTRIDDRAFFLPALSLFIFAGGVVAVNLALLASIQMELFGATFPYLDGAVSVSRVGRNPPVVYGFKPVMIVVMIATGFYWVSAARCLRAVGAIPGAQDTRDTQDTLCRFILLCGIVGAVAGFAYILTLGIYGDLYRLVRRVGVYFFISAISIAHILLVIRLSRMARRQPDCATGPALPALRGLIILMVLVFVPGMPVAAYAVGSWDRAENIVEWNYLLVLYVLFGVEFFIWRRLRRFRSVPDP